MAVEEINFDHDNEYVLAARYVIAEQERAERGRAAREAAQGRAAAKCCCDPGWVDSDCPAMRYREREQRQGN